MNNKFIKITASVLAAFSLLTFAGCNDCKNNTDDTGEENYLTGTSVPKIEGTIHEVSVGTTNHKIVENGRSEYKILVREEDRSKYAEAINELQGIFRSATGVQLEVELDTGATHDANAKYISLGETEAMCSWFTPDYQTLGTQGYQIRTKDKSVYICGQTYGILFGVYDLLNKLVDFEAYSDKITYTKTGLTEVALPDLNIKEVPDIETRLPVSGAQLNNKNSAHRMRMQINTEVMMAEGNAHNMLKYIVPLEEYQDIRSDWFSGDRTQLCYTAHGKEDEYEAMVEVAVENVKEIIDKNPKHSVMALTQMDVQTWCECDTCQGLEDEYGTNAASQIFFVNDVTEKVEKWLNEERDGREMQFMFFAYHKSEGAPAQKNENGEWEAINGIKVNDNVSVWIAPIYENYTISVNHSDSLNIRTMLESWHAVANSYAIWAYNVYFDNYLIPYDSYGALQDMVRYFVSHNTFYLWAQGNWNSHQNTGYDDLKAYLFSKLMWNCNLDVNTLIADYFDKVYREAADIMEGTFWAWRAHSESQRELNRSGNIYSSPKEKKFWTKRYLDQQLGEMEKAKKAIAHYETTDPELYQAIYDSIVCETISPRYLMLELYSSTFKKDELAAFKQAFKNDTNRLDFNMISEQESMDGYIE